jgi:ligand-binding SRPBCC domain-containing protein
MESRMFEISDSAIVRAPVERCFLLSTSLAIVQRELGMHPVAASYIGEDGMARQTRTQGLVRGRDRVRWEGWQLGLPQFHLSLISAYEPSHHFQDRMVAGRFRYFCHDHYFTSSEDGVVMQDTIQFSLPLGLAGEIAGRYIMLPHIAKLLRRRLQLLRQIAESEEWRQYLDAAE